MKRGANGKPYQPVTMAEVLARLRAAGKPRAPRRRAMAASPRTRTGARWLVLLCRGRDLHARAAPGARRGRAAQGPDPAGPGTGRA